MEQTTFAALSVYKSSQKKKVGMNPNKVSVLASALLFILLFLPVIAKARRKPATVIPDLSKADVLGVHCEQGEQIVGVEACQEALNRMRDDLGWTSHTWTVENCPDVMDKNEEVHVVCLPNNDADLMLDVWRDYDLGDIGAFLNTAMGGRLLHKDVYKIMYVNAVGDADKVADDMATFIHLHDGEMEKACADPDIGPIRLSPPFAGNKGWKRFVKICKKNRFPMTESQN